MAVGDFANARRLWARQAGSAAKAIAENADIVIGAKVRIEQAKDFHKTAEAMFKYGMSIAAEIADVFNVVKPYGESGEI